MKKALLVASAAIFTFSLTAAVPADIKPVMSGEQLFKEHCAICHPDGGNIINPLKTLRRADREANSVLTREDIIITMRHPGKGMTSWSASTLPDAEAGEIADYIIRTFK